MARSRNIKPGFFTNEDLVELHFPTRLLFAGLWTLADRDGRLEDRPRKIKMALFSADAVDVDSMLADLARMKFIIRYEINGEKYIQVTSWGRHQNPHHTEKASVIPEYICELTVKDALENKENKFEDGGNLADSLLLIPDSLNTDSLKVEATPAKPSPTPRKPAIAKPDEVNQQTWDDWLSLRKAKKAPVTLTTVDGAAEEATKAGMSLESFLRVWCRRGSQGLEASWLKDSERATATNAPAETTYQRSMRLRHEEATGTGQYAVIDMTTKHLEILQ